MQEARSASSRNALPGIVAVLLSAIMLALVAPGMFTDAPRAYTGIHAHFEPVVWPNVRTDGPTSYSVDPGSPAFAAGLRDGVQLGCLTLRDKTLMWQRIARLTPAFYPGVTLHFCARHGAAWVPVSVPVIAGARIGLPIGSIGIASARFAAVVVFYLCGIALLVARPGPMTWALFFFCLGNLPTATLAYFWPARLSDGLLSLLFIVMSMATSLTALFLMQFVLRLPGDRVDGWRVPAYRISLLITAAYGAYVTTFFIAQSPPGWFAFQFLSAIWQTLAAVIVLARLLTLERSERPRFLWAALGIFLGLLAEAGRSATAEIGTLLASICGCATVIMPLVLMYAILKRHLIDVRFVISRTVVYAAVTTLVVGVIGVVDWVTSEYLSQTKAAMAVDAAVTIALGFALHRTYGWFERVTDAILFRKKHQAQSYLERLAKSVLRAKHEETIDRALTIDPYETLDLTLAALFRRDLAGRYTLASIGGPAKEPFSIDADHDVVRFLCTERATVHLSGLRYAVAAQLAHGDAQPAVAVPLFQEDDLTAFALYGGHRDGTNLDPDEVATLETLCAAGSHGYTRIENQRYREAFSRLPAAPANA